MTRTIAALLGATILAACGGATTLDVGETASEGDGSAGTGGQLVTDTVGSVGGQSVIGTAGSVGGPSVTSTAGSVGIGGQGFGGAILGSAGTESVVLPDAGMEASAPDGGSATDGATEACVPSGGQSGSLACGGSDAAVETTDSLMRTMGRDCYYCAYQNCSNYFDNLNCETIDGNAATGPAAGTSKSRLCFDLLACELTTGCAGISIANCYCGPNIGASCFVSGIGNDGACLVEEQRALEDTEPRTIQSRFQTNTFGGGRANALLECIKINGCESCFPPGACLLDGIQNHGEQGVDCGGPCRPCSM
jgi:hypothetical protein